MGSLLLGAPLMDWDNTENAIQTILGQDINCFNPPEGEISEYPYDAIVILGGGIDTFPDGTASPNEFQKLRLEAGAIAYITKKAVNIILLDGRIYDGINPFIDRDYISQEVSRLSEGKIVLPDSSIVRATKSVNTASNMRELKQIAGENNWKHLLVITNNFHIPRSALSACAYDLNVYPRGAEDIIVEFAPWRKGEIEAFYEGQEMGKIMRKETLGEFAALFDSKGIAATIYKELQVP